ncbi:MAG TPA: hypothetical protein VNF07_02380 [Acidimicrobiales bacterium]|nr:hypothetical protein [Acidimicrobiales bacterium]
MLALVEPDPLRLLVEAAIAGHPDTPFGAYLFTADEPAAEIARHVEREIFLDAFGNDADQLAVEYGAYESRSVFFVVIDHGRRLPAGAMRLIAPGAAEPGLKSMEDVERFWETPAEALLGARGIVLAPERTWDIATLAVARDYQHALGSGLVSLGLYQSVVRSCREVGVEHLVALLDSLVYRITRARYAEPFIAYGEPRPYLGSTASYPVYCSLAEWEERLMLVEPPLLEIIYRGRGIEAACSPLDPELLASRIGRRPSTLV